jgi:tetratricopeptide (TPR) repeat protein
MPWQKTRRALRESLKKAQFNVAWDYVEKLDPNSFPDGENMNAKDIADALMLRSMAAEVADYRGAYKKARALVERAGGFCHDSLRSFNVTDHISNRNRKTTHQQVWCALQAGLSAYRATNYDGALSLFQVAENVWRNPHMMTLSQPRWGTQARIQYSIGLVHREKYELTQSVKCFTQSTELAYNSFLHEKDNQQEISALSYIALARSIGMGLASVHNTLGRPDLAAPLLMAAKAMLPRDEVLISTHLDLIRATLLQWSTQEHEVEDEPLKRLSQCHRMFCTLGHPLYRARAAYSLATAYIQRVRRDESKPLDQKDEEYLRLAYQFLKKDLDYQASGDLRFPLYAALLRSEIARKKGEYAKAESDASRGLLETSSSQHPSLFLDLSLARGLARTRNGNLKGAIEDFSAGAATAEIATNRRLQAVFYLHLSQAYAGLDQDLEAGSYFSRFEELDKFMEAKTHDVQILAASTRIVLDTLDKRKPGLRFSLNDKNLDPEVAQQKLRRFLVEWARKDTKSDAEAIKKLKRSRQTFYKWQGQ